MQVFKADNVAILAHLQALCDGSPEEQEQALALQVWREWDSCGGLWLLAV
jgi:hypothetical protein